METKLSDFKYSPTEAECIDEIRKNLHNFYIILQRGDIIITRKMKDEAFMMFKKTRMDPTNGLANATDDWFIRTQMRGWNARPKLYDSPYGFTQEQIAKLS